jgi:hypothetical protein
VIADVEDTRERGLQHCGGCAREQCRECPYEFEPRLSLEIADCSDGINLEVDVDTETGCANSLQELDTLVTALRVFREAQSFESSRGLSRNTVTPWPRGEARLQSALRRFDSARCLSASHNGRE